MAGSLTVRPVSPHDASQSLMITGFFGACASHGSRVEGCTSDWWHCLQRICAPAVAGTDGILAEWDKFNGIRGSRTYPARGRLGYMPLPHWATDLYEVDGRFRKMTKCDNLISRKVGDGMERGHDSDLLAIDWLISPLAQSSEP